MEESKKKFSRQILTFGREGQRRIANAKVGIVGLGGIGSLITQMLAYLGVQEFILVDDDIVEESNLNRLVGASREDVINKTPKVDVARRVVNSINPSAKIKGLFQNLRSEEAIDVLCCTPEIIFGCVDNDAARLILTELCAAYNKILIDSGAQIINTAEFQEFGGQVIVARPGDFCLLCAAQVDLEIARQELESEQEKEFKESLGYGLGRGVVDPAVVSLNGIIAGLAVTEFLMLVTGLREPNRRVTYRGMRGVFRESIDKKRSDCIICNTIAGRGEQAGIKRYIRNGLPKDLPT
ncbi:MAG: ThiF family adenylyltransferase [Candidatus Omnitrophota bacterium]